MTVEQSVPELLIGEIFSTAAGIEGSPAQIDRIRPILHSGPQGLRRTGGGEQFWPHPFFRRSSCCCRRKTSRFSSLTSLWALPASSR